MTEQEAKKRVQQHVENEPNEEDIFYWVGDVYVETADTFIFDVSFYEKGWDPKDWEHSYYAIHKTTGKCGYLMVPPGPIFKKEDYENFSWDHSSFLIL